MVARLLVVLAICVSSGCCCCTMPMGNVNNVPPGSPDPLTVTRRPGDPTTVDLRWRSAMNSNTYTVYQRSNNGDWQIVPGVGFGTTHTVQGLNPQTRYEFRVDASGPGGTTQGTPVGLDPLPK
jgi:hypothetical protein